MGERHPHTFLPYIETWLRSHRCDSGTQIRTASQKSTVKQENPAWKFLQANAPFIRIIWCGNAVTTPLFSALHPWASSNYTCVVSFLAFVRYQQNRPRKLFNREALRLRRRTWHSKIWQKIHWFIVFHSSILGVWKFVWWGLSPPKPPVATELVTNRHLFQKLYYHTMPNYQNESNTFSKLFLLKWLFLWLQMLLHRWTMRTSMKLTLPTDWLWFTLLTVQTYNLSSKLDPQTRQLRYPVEERHFPTALLHKKKQQLRWNWAMLPLLSSSL